MISGDNKTGATQSARHDGGVGLMRIDDVLLPWLPRREVETDGGARRPFHAAVCFRPHGSVSLTIAWHFTEIKIGTFPSPRYGVIHGRVAHISREAVEEPQSEQQWWRMAKRQA